MLKLCVRSIFPLALTMAGFGLLILAYAGKAQAAGAYHFFAQQAVFLVVACVAALVLCRIDYRFYRNRAVLWMLVGVMLLSLAMVLVPGIGKSVKGSHRWIALGPLSVQPIEFVKLLMVVFLSAYLDRQAGLINRFFRGVFIPVSVIGATVMLLVLQPDFGGAMILCFLAGITLLVGGIGWKRCVFFACVGIVAIGALLLTNENRMKRLMNEREGTNYQAQQAEIAFNNGHVFGVGLGAGMQKERYLPECHTDFILAIIGEDLGLVATATVWLAFLLFFLCGLVISFSAPDKQGMLLAFGATMMICAQAAANMAVVTHLFPTKGLALPFFSYGGSSLLSTFSAVGVLLSVGRRAADEGAAAEESAAARRLISFT